MSPDDRDFDRDLERAFRGMHERRGHCPTSEVLAGYLNDSLAADERARVERHVAGCGLCDCLLEKLQSFEAPAPPETSVNWPPAEQRMRRHILSGARPRGRSMLSFLEKPALAYSVAIVAMGWAYWGNSERRSVSPIVPPAAGPGVLESVRSIDLNLTRGEGAKPAIGSNEQRLLLSFFVPVRPGFQYRASIDGGAAIDIASHDGLGNFHLLCNRALIGLGKHVLTVTETNRDTGKTERSVDFEFHF